MFSKLIQNAEISHSDQRAILKGIVQTNLKQNVHQVRLQLTHNYQKLKPILISHWKYSLHIAYALVNWQSSRDFLEGKRQNIVFDLILTITNLEDSKMREYAVVELFKVYSQHWKWLAILYTISDVIADKIGNVDDYSWLIASFIRISAGIIQSYLKIKNQPAKSNEDRIDNDKILIDNCEKWVTNAYITFLGKLKSPQTRIQKRVLLSAFSQIVGALYESERQGYLKKELLQDILDGAITYIFKRYSLDQIYELWTEKLQKSGYNNPIKKLQIPERYNQTSDISTEGTCWIMNKYLQNSTDVYSKAKLLDVNLLIYSEMLPTAFQLKEQAYNNVALLLQTATFSANFELKYPLCLLLFNIYHFNRGKYSTLSQKLGFNNNNLIKINRLKRLLQLKIDHLIVEKTQFVLVSLDKYSLAQKEVLLLLKTIQFNFTNPQLSKLISKLYEKIVKEHGDIGRKIARTVVERERRSKHNSQLCNELQKAILQ